MDFSAFVVFADVNHPGVDGDVDEDFASAPEEQNDAEGEEGGGRVRNAQKREGEDGDGATDEDEGFSAESEVEVDEAAPEEFEDVRDAGRADGEGDKGKGDIVVREVEGQDDGDEGDGDAFDEVEVCG